MTAFGDAEVEAQIATLTSELEATPAGTPQAATIEAQIAVLQNEVAEDPLVPPIFPNFFPNIWRGGGGGRRGR
jgi:hypothetical protein